nr:MAG TPA_asm: hypothetical protein [Caudoviricetes sp.]
MVQLLSLLLIIFMYCFLSLIRKIGECGICQK